MKMATRAMYKFNPHEFLAWYYHRFTTYRDYGPNEVHKWLSDKNVNTQNIDGLDGKAGNKNYIAIHGRLDQMTLYQKNGLPEPIAAPWHKVDESRLNDSLLELFNIENKNPKVNRSFKPYVLLFDEYYTELYRFREAKQRMLNADKMVFIGTSFNVGITNMALQIAAEYNKLVEIVDPDPVAFSIGNITYKK